jgi:Ca2+-binding EF-hand superfamily protein
MKNRFCVSGSCSVVQFAVGRCSALGRSRLICSAIRLVGRFDTNHDKQLDIDERAGARLPLSADRFDDDNDGLLSIMEVATMLSRHRRDLGLTVPDQKKLRSLMQRDLDGDGTITPEELKPFGETLTQNYAQFDGNKDGLISVKEIESHLSSVRKERGYGPEQFNVAARLLERHDTDRSKLIDASELHDQPSKGKLGRNILVEADLDKDSKISVDELSRYLVKHPPE